jgi:glutamyl/glutaminyl-tRNA synthetase
MYMDKMPSFKKTRIAPTPSGYLHLGNVLSFALTAALARKTGAGILLRIDDLDRGRVSKDYVEDIFETLRFLGIPWDEGPRNPGEYEREYTQLRRMELYGEALRRLREERKLFACTCSRTQVLRDSTDGGYAGTCRNKGIPLDTEGCIWRIRTEAAGEIGVKGIAGVSGGSVAARGKGIAEAGVQGIAEAAGEKEIRAALPVEMTDFVVRKRDGFPAYQLTSVIDDLHYGIDLVVRGEDLWYSTLAQHWLAGELGRGAFKEIHFYHHALLMETGGLDGGAEGESMRAGGAKLSKSAGATSVRYLRGQGVQAADLYPMIVHMLGMDFQAGSWEELAAGVMGDVRHNL